MFGLYLDDYQASLLTIKDSVSRDSIHGYALVNFYDAGFEMSEIAIDPGDPEALRGIPLQGQLTITTDPTTQSSLKQFFGRSLHTVDDTVLHDYPPFMVRPIGDPATAPFTWPGSLFWPLDAY